jgi:hypothetical protein
MHTRTLEDRLKRLREERIVNDVAAVIQKSVFDVGSIPRDLAHPGSVWRGDDSSDLDLTRLELDHEEHEVPHETPPRDPFEGEEVGRGDRAPHAPSGRSSNSSVAVQRDRFHSPPGFACRVSANGVPEPREGALDSGVAPSRDCRSPFRGSISESRRRSEADRERVPRSRSRHTSGRRALGTSGARHLG